MKKRIVAFVLALLTVVAMLPALGAAAKTTSYDAAAALSYAKQHWNDGKGLCAEFVSRCVKAGGVDMKVQATTGRCMKAIRNSTYLPEVELKLDKNGYATKALNEGILSPGDPVVQYCATHKTRPHILLCGGFDSQGRATFYAHNGAMNNKVYKLSVNTAYEHTKSCDMRAHVIHLADLDSSSSGGGAENIGGIGTSNVSEVKFSLPKDDTWRARMENREHGGTTVGCVEKPAGVSVTRIGIRIMDYYWNPLVEYSFPVTKVKDSDTKFYFWFDTEKDVGMTMNAGTIYRYHWFGIFDGEEIEAYPNSYFKTTGETTYTVTFDPNGGELTGSATATIKSGKTFNESGIWPSEPTREGYLFWGWLYDPEDETNTAYPGQWVQGNITLYASWMRDPSVPEGFNVLFYDPMTDEFYDSVKVTNGETYGTLPAPTRPDAAFVGWYTEIDGGTQVTADSIVSLEEDQTLYARWETDPELTVTLRDFDSGKVYGTKTVMRGETYGDLEAPEREGYIFDGWYNGVGDEITPSTVVTAAGDETLYCMWTTWEAQTNDSEYAFMIMPKSLGMNERFTFFVRPHDGYEVVDIKIEDRENNKELDVGYDDYGNGVYRTTRTTGSFWIRPYYRKTAETPAESGVKTSFVDVPAGMWCEKQVAWAVENGVTNGIDTAGTKFGPNDTCTQGHILTFLYRAAKEPTVNIASPYSNSSVRSGEFYYNAMLWAYREGIVTDRALDPNAPCTRSDVVTYLWRLADSPSSGKRSFADVPAGAAYVGAVSWAVENGITNGVDTAGTKFGPTQTCTRGQIVTFLYRYFVESLNG